jgi:hypothetical protein
MKAFDLNQALAGAPLVTRNGQPAEFEKFKPGSNYPVRCRIAGKSYSFTPGGTVWKGAEDPMDLFVLGEVR